MRQAAFGAAVLAAVILAGCGPQPTRPAARTAPRRPTVTRVRPPRPGQVTAMPALAARLQTIPAARVPRLPLVNGQGRPVQGRLTQWPNVVVVAPALDMGPLWQELRAARPFIHQPVMLVAADWPVGTTLAQARATVAHVLGPHHLGWSVVYVWPPGGRFIPAPTTLLTRGAATSLLGGVLPSARAWTAVLDLKMLPRRGTP